MVENTATVEVKTESQLMAELQKAMSSGDFKQVAKVSQELVKFQKSKEQAEQDARIKVLEAVCLKVKQTIERAVQRLIDNKELDAADGIWYVNDFGEKLTSCRLMKTATKTRTGGGGGGKKFSVSTTDLLQKYGSQEYKDGTTFQSAWDADADKNKRYAVREALLKKEGLIS